jgi:hypothetical protein
LWGWTGITARSVKFFMIPHSMTSDILSFDFYLRDNTCLITEILKNRLFPIPDDNCKGVMPQWRGQIPQARHHLCRISKIS